MTPSPATAPDRPARLRRRVIATLAAAAAIGAVVSLTWSALFSATANPDSSFSTGTVDLSDNDAGASMLSLVNARPGDSDTGCIRVTYSGSLDATVRLHAAVSGSLAQYLDVTVTRGTDSSPSFDSCGSFAPDAANYTGAGPGVVYSGRLSAFPASYGAGIVDPVPGSPETWTASETHSYRVTVTLANDPAAQGLSASADFRWEARNQ